MPDVFVSDTKIQEPEEKTAEVVENNPPAKIQHVEENGSGSVHLFTSYCEKPDDISFQNQEEDEKVLLFIRKDFITNIPWVVTGIILLFVPLLAIPLLPYLHFAAGFLPPNYLLILTIFYYLALATFMYINFIIWYFNLDLVTDRRIIDIEFSGIVYKDVAATKLSLVQDVSYAQNGLIRTIFDYGDVLVQTAGTIDNFTFDAVPKPEDAVHVVENLIGK